MDAIGEGALVLFSGGQDSTTCLAWALERFDRVETIGFYYGQRHDIEMDCRELVRKSLQQLSVSWANHLGADHLINLKILGEINETALTRNTPIVMQEHNHPNTFVPGRNLVFLNFAAITAYNQDLRHIVGGMSEIDYSGYPDCRDQSIKALEKALNLGMGSKFVFHTPLMKLEKAQVWDLASNLGGEALVTMIQKLTHTCYLGDRNNYHDWGYGCGTCPACHLRKNGWKKFKMNA